MNRLTCILIKLQFFSAYLQCYYLLLTYTYIHRLIQLESYIMKRYSVAPSSARRKSTINPGIIDNTAAARAELEKLEQETTLVLQEIDKDLSRANAVINDCIFPLLKKYSNLTEDVWNNVRFWKYFFEQSANVELSSYEARANTTTDVNTLANRKSNFLPLDDEDDKEEALNDKEEGIENEHNKKTSKVTSPKDLFKKPHLKGTVEESTPTWSIEQTKGSSRKFQSSTPQNKRHLDTNNFPKHALRFDSDSIGLQAPPLLSNTVNLGENNSSKVPSHFPTVTSPTKTQTIRQSLDNYHKVSISHRKLKTTPSPRLNEDMRRRSSMIQNLINSSPTLPEPPILQSEIGSSSNRDNTDPKISEHVEERLSPVVLPPHLSPSKSGSPRKSKITPYKSNIKTNKDIMRTPIGISLKYGEDDSDIAPPELKNTQVFQKDNSKNSIDDFELEIPIPELETDVLNKKRKLDNGNDDDKFNGHNDRNNQQDDNRRDLPGEDDDNENVFLDNFAKNNSVQSTLYHSILNQQESRTSQSKENTGNQSYSRSISHIFDEVISEISKADKGQNTQQDERFEILAKDLFGNLSASQIDTTGNSTSELGSLLEERYKNLTNQNN